MYVNLKTVVSSGETMSQSYSDFNGPSWAGDIGSMSEVQNWKKNIRAELELFKIVKMW